MRPEVEHKGAKVYIYTRVSTAMQVDGFSLDAQKDEILKEVRRHDMVVAGEYSDEGKSGKSISGREDFQRMLDDIVARKDDIRFVIVYKLSRFGRNTADILNTLKTMKFYGVHLICAADNIDSSMDSGKLMISILGAVAEIERENILAQTMAGRKEKARQGLFNGGITPFGYKSVEGKLEVVDAEAEVVRLIFDKYTKTEMGFPSIAKWLNDQGYEKGYRCKNSSNFFNERNVKQIIDNPVYTGRMAYGRTVTKAKENDPESSHRVKATEYILAEGQHEAIIDMETWEAACRKRKETGGRKDKIEKEHEYILSGLVKCPECGRSMYGVPMRGRKRKDGTMYPVYYSYMCRKSIEDRALGHKCSFGQVGCGKIDGEVRDVIMKLVNGENFGSVMSELVGESIDTQELERMMDQAYKDIRQAKGLQRKLEAELDALDVMDKHYERRYESCNRRLEAAFDSLDEAEQRLADAEAKMESVQRQGLTRDSVYEVLKLFGDIYDKMTDYEKKVFMQSFVESVELYPKEGRKRGTSVKTVHFHFPVSYKGESVYEISPPKGQTVETVCLLSKLSEV